MYLSHCTLYFFFFNDTATTEIYTLSLHDALPIWSGGLGLWNRTGDPLYQWGAMSHDGPGALATEPRRQWLDRKSTTSELQAPCKLVCRLLLVKKTIMKLIRCSP